MAQRSGLFDSTEIVETIDGYPRGNRAETADFFAKYFSNFISNGVFANPSTNFKVMAQSGPTVVVRPGVCFINGYMAWDTAEETHTFAVASEQQDWYFIQRMYLPDGTITKTWVQDNSGTTLPVRTATTYDLVLAMVRLPAGAANITDSMITDYRYDNSRCGIVHAAVDHIDTTELATQLNRAAEEFIAAAETSLVTWQGTFDQWFNAVKGQLSGDAATALEASKTARTYAVCETAADTAAKTAALDGYYLAPGQTVYVRFINSVPGGATLNVNGTGNVPMYNRGQAITGADIPAGATAALVYNGERYDLLNAVASAAGVKYVTASGTSAVVVNTPDGLPVQLKDGDRFSVGFTNEVAAKATLNINGIGAYPIIDNYTGAAIVNGDIPADYIGDIMFEDGKFLLLNALRLSASPQGYQMFTANDTFIVPPGVNSIRVSACAAGVGRYAGEWMENQIFNVSPGEPINLTIGSGNTVIGELATLIAGTYSGSVPSTKLGYATGYTGGSSSTYYQSGGTGGYGGKYGFGGGGAGSVGTGSTYYYGSGGGGAGIGGDGSQGDYQGGSSQIGVASPGKGGGTSGGSGGYSSNSYSQYTQYNYNGANAQTGALIYKGAQGTFTKGGDGSVYGAGGGGGAAGEKTSEKGYGGGGAAGGYGAGGGQNGMKGASNFQFSTSTTYGQPSGGMVLIEWGGTVA